MSEDVTEVGIEGRALMLYDGLCGVCNKNITLEQESAAASSFGEGAKVLSLIGSPKPPKTERRKSSTEAGPDDPTL